MRIRYFVPANDELKAMAMNTFKIRKKFTRDAMKLSKECGGVAFAYIFSQNKLMMAGIEFDNPPDPKLWKKNRHNPRVWHPKVCNKEIHARVLAMVDRSHEEVEKFMGLKRELIATSRGMSMPNLVIFHVPDEKKPTGVVFGWGGKSDPPMCERISDVEAERLGVKI